jgi:ABC-2 type transport system ATP-binding protein
MLRAVQLVIVRHAEAASGEPDELRPLTAEGRETARALGQQLAREGVHPDAVLTSPLLRARETAQELARPAGLEPEPDERLAPGATAESVLAAVQERGKTVVVVGHRRRGACVRAGRDGRDRPLHVTAIAVRGLRKSYGALEAVRGIDFEVRRGEVFGLLGPNGAGKTTTVEILEGYRRRDGGEVEVLGVDPAVARGDWRERIGVVLQSSAMYETLTVVEMLRLFAGYYREPRPVDEVVSLVGLDEKRGDRVRRLSGGQRRRLDLGLALVGDPELIFLDEPTTGFDPRARRQAWETIRGLRGLGKTILLTTHYLDEAEQLADRVAVLAQGRIVASGAPAELTGAVPATEIRYRENGREVVLETDEPTRVLNELTGRALAESRELEGLVVRRPSLEEVYLSLTEEEPP